MDILIGGVILIVVVIIILFIIILASYMAHLDQVTEFTKEYKYGSYKDFYREFNSIKFKKDYKWNNSWFSEDDKSEVHADIYRFNDIGMMMEDPIEYFKTLMFLHSIKRIEKEKIKNWEE